VEMVKAAVQEKDRDARVDAVVWGALSQVDPAVIVSARSVVTASPI